MQVDIVAVTPDLALGTDISNVFGTASVIGGGTEAGAIRVTIANNSTGVVSVDDNGGALTVDNAGTFAAQIDGAALTALQLIDDPVFADDAAFTLATSKTMVAGVIRDDALSALTAVEGDVVPLRVNSTGALHITGAAAGTEFNEDTAHTTGAAGAQILGVRRDADTSPVSADGDYHHLVFNNAGALKVEVFDSGDAHTVDNAGTFVVQEDGAALTALQLIDNIVSVEDAVHGSGDSGVMALAVRNDTLAALATTDGDYAPIQVNASGALFIQEGSALDVSAATLTVNAHAVTNAGTFAVQEDGAALTALQIIDNIVSVEDAVHGSGDSGVMALAVRNDALAALAGTDGDYAPLQVNASGALFIQEGSALDVSGATLTVNAHAVTNAGTFVVQEDGAALTALQIIDNPVFADDAAFTLASSSVSVAGAIRDDALSTLTAVEGDAVPLRVGSTGALHVTGSAGVTEFAEDTAHTTGALGNLALGVRRDADTSPVSADADYHTMIFNSVGALKVEIFDGGDTLTVGSHAVTNAGTFAVQVSDTSFAVADGNALGEGVLVQGDDGTDRKNINVDATTGDVQVDVTNTVTVDLGANNDVTIDSSSIVKAEDAAHSSGDAGVMSLAVRNDDLAALAGTDGDYAPFQVTENGALLSCPAANDAYLYAVIDDATSGNNTIIAAVASRKIRVLAYTLIAAGTVNARWEDGAGGTALSGQMNLVANSGASPPFNPGGHFETGVNTLLNLELSAGISVDGHLTYILVP